MLYKRTAGGSRKNQEEKNMQATTRLFGTIDIPDDKIIVLENGMIGFPDMQKFALIFDADKKDGGKIKWLQSMDEPDTAFPVMDPTLIKEDYNPTINDEILKPLGELNDDNIFVLSTVTVPKQLEKMSINLKAPIVINADTRKGAQIIVEDDMPVKYMIYDLLKSRKEKAGE